jgi:uncharacterized protein
MPAPTGAISNSRFAWAATFIVVIVSAIVLTMSWPKLDHSAEPLGSINSEAARVAKRIDEKMSRSAETDWIIVRGRDEAEVRDRLEKVSGELKFYDVELPLPLWPQTDLQKVNLPVLRQIREDLPKLTKAVIAAGFTEEAMSLTASMVDAWNSITNAWPQQNSTRWLIERVAVKSDNGVLAMGLLRTPANVPLPLLKTPGAYVASWARLASVLLAKVQLRMIWLTVGMITLLVICLRMALRRWTEVLLSFATLAFGFMMTLVAMSLLGWKWNLLSLTAIPLLLGAAVDYTIHVQMALRRYNGDAAMMRRTIGRALFLVTAAAVAGFGSLAMASNAGLASFELVCALGMIAIFVTALYLLPAWHYTFTKSNG